MPTHLIRFFHSCIDFTTGCVYRTLSRRREIDFAPDQPPATIRILLTHPLFIDKQILWEVFYAAQIFDPFDSLA